MTTGRYLVKWGNDYVMGSAMVSRQSDAERMTAARARRVASNMRAGGSVGVRVIRLKKDR